MPTPICTTFQVSKRGESRYTIWSSPKWAMCAVSRCSICNVTSAWTPCLGLGAAVTGLDFSNEAIKLARALSEELKIPARFICADLYEATGVPEDKYDVVFTSYGAITWLPDMRRWAQIITTSLKADGFFYIADQHPFASIFNNADEASELAIQYPYFRQEMILSSGGQD
jgi:SAM-dependent methyltransferase